MCNANGKLYGCCPVPYVVLPIALFTLLLEFIFFVCYLVVIGGTYAPLTKLFLQFTFDPTVHCLLVASTIVLFLMPFYRMPALVAPYGIMAIVTILWGLCKSVEIIAILNKDAAVQSYVRARGYSTKEDDEWGVRIVALLWNIFLAPMFGTCAGFVIACAKQITMDNSAAELNLPFGIGSRGNKLPDAAPSVNPQPDAAPSMKPQPDAAPATKPE